MFGFKSRTKYTRQITNFLDRQIVMLHETFDTSRASMNFISEPFADLSLSVKGQPFFCSTCQIVKMAPYRPEKILRACKPLGFGCREKTLCH